MTVTIDQILWPLRGFDVVTFYRHYGPFVDFVLYAFLFVSLAFVTIGRRFEHRGLAITVGLMLAIALAVVEPTIGFSIRNLGGIAAGILVVLVGSLIYGFIRHFGMRHLGAASLALVVVYMGLVLYSPKLVDWMNREFPLLGLILLVAVGVAVYQFVAPLVRGGVRFAEFVRSGAGIVATGGTDTDKGIKRPLRRGTRNARRDSLQIIAEIDDMAKVLKHHGLTPEARADIARRLQAIKPRRHDLAEQLEKVAALTRDIEASDRQTLARLNALPPQEQARARDEMAREVEKLHANHQLRRFQQAVATYQAYFDRYLASAMQSVGSEDTDGAIRALGYCRKAEKRAIGFLQRMRRAENRLVKLAKRRTA